MEKSQFIKDMNDAYNLQGDRITLGAAMFNDQPVSDVTVSIPLKMLNRHGLIAGATGTGKTKSVQYLAGRLSKKGIPVLLMDIKGDLSGIAKPGKINEHIQERQQFIGLPFTPSDHPVELLSLSDEKGVRLKATVSEFGPVLFSKMLNLNDTQTGVMALLYKYCDDHKMPLLDLKDVKKTLQFLTHEGKQEIQQDYGRISPQSAGAITRRIIELEQQGAERFFGEKSFEVDDLIRTDKNGEGMISILRLTDIQTKPKLFSTFMLSLLAEIYSSFPEEGDPEKPKLIIFIDEAHLMFEEASDALLDQLKTIVKLIRSKGVGLFFCTQTPSDIPASILGQLGLKVQHALRAFTAADRKKIKKIAGNYPLSDYYDTDQLLTQLGTGQALITALSEKGTPTPLVATLLCAPDSRMDILTEKEIQDLVDSSDLIPKYNTEIDPESAYEILNKKLEAARKEVKERSSKSTFEEIIDSSFIRDLGRTFIREVTRGILGVLGLGGKSRRRKKQ